MITTENLPHTTFQKIFISLNNFPFFHTLFIKLWVKYELLKGTCRELNVYRGGGGHALKHPNEC